MVQALESYALGRWPSPTDAGVTVADANTGEPVARVSASGSTSAPWPTTGDAPAGRRSRH